MSDIFLSYASLDRPRVVPLVRALQQKGWSVWWDRSVLAGRIWDEVIEAALTDARCVIVLWSRASVRSDWVLTEAEEARRRGILVPALLENVDIPLAFRRIQAANLEDWTGALPSLEFDELAAGVSEVFSRASQSRKPAALVGQSATRVRSEVAQTERSQMDEQPVLGSEPERALLVRTGLDQASNARRYPGLLRRMIWLGILAFALVALAISSYSVFKASRISLSSEPAPPKQSQPSKAAQVPKQIPSSAGSAGPNVKSQLAAVGPPVTTDHSIGSSPASQAADPFCGRWRFNQGKSKIAETIEDLGDDMFRFQFVGGTATITADGTDQSVGADRTMSLTKEGPNRFKIAEKRDSQLIYSETRTLSDDESSQTVHLTNRRANGTISYQEWVETRVGHGSGWAGTWETTSLKSSSPDELSIKPYGASGLTLEIAADQDILSMNFDGRDYSEKGPRVLPGSTASGKRTDAHTLDAIDKVKDEVVDRTRYRVSSDGKTLTLTIHNTGQANPLMIVYDKM